MIDALPLRATESFAGVGNPLALGDLRTGEVVLDLGCGAGMDSILAADRVGPTGRVIGVDMTGPMVEKARANASAIGIENAEFHRGEADRLPVVDGSVDVVISNGVFNLCPDKPRVLAEVFRVLRPGGRLLMADILLDDGVTAEQVERQGDVVRLNRRCGMGAVAPPDVDRSRVCRSRVPRLDGLLHFDLHQGRFDHRPETGRGDEPGTLRDAGRRGRMKASSPATPGLNRPVRSDLPRMGTALELEAKGIQEFEDRPAIGPQRRLVLGPGLRMRQRLIDAPSAPGRPLDDSPVHQEQQDGRALMQRRAGPELGTGQVVLEMEAGVSGGLFEEGESMLVVTMGRVVGQAAGPVAGQLIHE